MTIVVPLAPAALAVTSFNVTPPEGAVMNMFPVKLVWLTGPVTFPRRTVLAVAEVLVKVRLPAPVN